MNVGFIGLGNMGLPMASHMAALDFVTVTAYSRKLQEFESQVLNKFSITADLLDLSKSDVIVTMVTGDKSLEDIFFKNHFIEHLKKDVIHLSCSTISVAMGRRLAEQHESRGQFFVCAPVVGRSDKAKLRQLVALVSGSEIAKNKVSELIRASSHQIFDFGDDPTSAIAVKLANNFMIGSCIELLGQAFSITDAHHIKRDEFLGFITNSLFSAPIFDVYGKLILEKKYFPATSPLAIGQKDMGLAIDAVSEKGITLPFAEIVKTQLQNLVNKNLAELDWAVLGDKSYSQLDK